VKVVLYLLLFVPALVAAAFVVRRRRVVVLAEATIPENAFESLEQALTELERARLDDLDELERLAELLETTAKRLERVG
jgi:hypothetical protein